jgi:hypothetical protein
MTNYKFYTRLWNKVERIFKGIIMSSEKSSSTKIVKHHPRERKYGGRWEDTVS